MTKQNCIALDMGASSVRAILGQYNGEKLELQELRRSINEPCVIRGELFWNVLNLYQECQRAIEAYDVRMFGKLLSFAIDGWGSDYGLLDRNGYLISNPCHYRHHRTENIMNKTRAIMDERRLFDLTGNASIRYNTVYQLLSMKEGQCAQLENAHTLLMIPDLLAYFFTGERYIEYTNATTTQLTAFDRNGWNKVVMETLKLPIDIMPPIIQPGYIYKNAWEDAALIATASHDTACAVAAIPRMEENTAFISSGTWSLVGAETQQPVVNDKVYKYGYSNEGGVGGKNLLLRNTVGMWIIQQCMNDWRDQGENPDYTQLLNQVEKEPAFMTFIDVDDDDFASPGDMPEKVRKYCKRKGKVIPSSIPAITRCILESMAFKYRICIENLEDILEQPLSALHIVGGGSQNDVLNMFTANALNKPVISGPVEAAAAGNIAVQLMAFGEIAGLNEIRELIDRSFTKRVYEPVDTIIWNEAFESYRKAVG
jgi:sugar (pentulose or hexulose) kinase